MRVIADAPRNAHLEGLRAAPTALGEAASARPGPPGAALAGSRLAPPLRPRVGRRPLSLRLGLRPGARLRAWRLELGQLQERLARADPNAGERSFIADRVVALSEGVRGLSALRGPMVCVILG